MITKSELSDFLQELNSSIKGLLPTLPSTGVTPLEATTSEAIQPETATLKAESEPPKKEEPIQETGQSTQEANNVQETKQEIQEKKQDIQGKQREAEKPKEPKKRRFPFLR